MGTACCVLAAIRSIDCSAGSHNSKAEWGHFMAPDAPYGANTVHAWCSPYSKKIMTPKTRLKTPGWCQDFILPQNHRTNPFMNIYVSAVEKVVILLKPSWNKDIPSLVTTQCFIKGLPKRIFKASVNFNINDMLCIWIEGETETAASVIHFLYLWHLRLLDDALFAFLSLAVGEKNSKQVTFEEILFLISHVFPPFFSAQLGARLKNSCWDKTENSSWVQHVVWTWQLDLLRTKPLPQVLRLVIFSRKGGSTCFNRWKCHRGQTYFPQLCCR